MRDPTFVHVLWLRCQCLGDEPESLMGGGARRNVVRDEVIEKVPRLNMCARQVGQWLGAVSRCCLRLIVESQVWLRWSEP
jgi:hypothetical protein